MLIGREVDGDARNGNAGDMTRQKQNRTKVVGRCAIRREMCEKDMILGERRAFACVSIPNKCCYARDYCDYVH